jgi:hypothetical protein
MKWFLADNHGTPYDVRGAFDSRDLPIGRLYRRLAGKEDLASLFCSELCPAALRRAGVWRDENVSSYSPNRFCRTGVRRGVLAYPGVILPDELEDAA